MAYGTGDATRRSMDDMPSGISRQPLSPSPNHHLTFSHGMHYCLGAALARVEGRVAIGSLVRRFPTIELVTQELHYRDHFVLRGLEELRVSV